MQGHVVRVGTLSKCALTIHSSRRRFAARLNSGVSWDQSWVQHFEFSDKAQDQGHFLRCEFLPRADHNSYR